MSLSHRAPSKALKDSIREDTGYQISFLFSGIYWVYNAGYLVLYQFSGTYQLSKM